MRRQEIVIFISEDMRVCNQKLFLYWVSPSMRGKGKNKKWSWLCDVRCCSDQTEFFQRKLNKVDIEYFRKSKYTLDFNACRCKSPFFWISASQRKQWTEIILVDDKNVITIRWPDKWMTEHYREWQQQNQWFKYTANNQFEHKNPSIVLNLVHCM